MVSRLGFDALAALALALTALLGAYTPAYLARRDRLAGGTGRSLAYVLGNMLSAGVMVSAGFCHLLGEALKQMPKMQFPLAPFLCGVGYLFTLVADRIAASASGHSHGGCAHHSLPTKGPAVDSCTAVEVLAGVGIAERGVLAAPGRLGKHSSEPEALGLLERSPSPRHSSKARRDAGDASVRQHSGALVLGGSGGHLRHTRQHSGGAALEEGLAHGSGNGGLLHGGAAGSNGGLLRGGSGGSNGGLYDPHPSLLPLHGLADGGLLEQGGSLGGSPGGSLRGGGAPAEAMGRRPSIDGFTAGAGLVGRRRPGQQDSSESLSFELGPPEASEGPLLGGAVGAPGAAGAAGGRHVSFLTAMLMGVALCFHSLLEGAAMGAQPTISNSLHIFIAIVSHKGLAAYALGSSIVDSDASMRRFWSVILPFTFASPIGIFLGYIVSDLAKGVGAASISALASGTFLYVAFMEVIPKELREPAHVPLKLAALLVGFCLMSVLAIWA